MPLLHWTLLGLLALTLMACGGPGGAPPVAGPEAPDRAVASPRPRFADHDPVDWAGSPPWSYPVHGIDVSRWQPPIDWAAARAAGVSFAFIKATEGVEDLDPMFHAHWAGAGRAGLPRGAYHYFYFCVPADRQARWFIANVPRAAASLPHVLDMEWNPHSPTCRLRSPGLMICA